MAKIASIVLFVPDIAASRQFYEKLLDIAPTFANDRFVQYTLGDCSLALHAARDETTHGVHLHIEVTSVDEFVAGKSETTLVFSGPPKQQPWGTKSVTTCDPSGNEVEIFSRG